MATVAMLQQPRWCPMCTGAWGWGAMLMGLFWVLVIVGVAWLLWRSAQSGGRGFGPSGAGRAVEILQERYARGEIDADTYHRMLEDLRRPPPA
jgi:putative membrane protein